MYKLILMDLQMPVMDGIKACEKIMQFLNEKSPELAESCHILALTSYSNKTEECLKAGMKKVYNKPLNSKDLF